MPDPGGDVGFPWLWWKAVGLNSNATGVSGDLGISVVRYDFDSKAMRKVKIAESLALIVEYSDIVGTPAVDVDIAQTRVLVGT